MYTIKSVHFKALIALFIISSFVLLCFVTFCSVLSFDDSPFSNEPEKVDEALPLNFQLETNALDFPDLQLNKVVKSVKLAQVLNTDQQKNLMFWTLCRLKLSKACFSNNIAEVIDTFWVIAPLYAIRQGSVDIMYTHHSRFQSLIASIGLKFCTIEAIRKDRNQKYMMTTPNNEPEEIQTEFFDDLYLRENFVNVAAKRIPDWEYIAWIDAHQVFENPYWWQESIHSMEKYGSVQMFQQLQRLNALNGSLNMDPGSLYVTTFLSKGWDLLPYYGNAFGIRREMYEKIEYILDTCIASCCDCLYTYALLDDSVQFHYMDRWGQYLQNFKNWTDQAKSVFQGKRKSIRGKLFHLKHEEKFSYFALLEAANNLDFNVERDLERNTEFVILLNNTGLEKEIAYINFFSYYSFEILLGYVVIGCAIGIVIIIVLVYCARKRRIP